MKGIIQHQASGTRTDLEPTRNQPQNRPRDTFSKVGGRFQRYLPGAGPPGSLLIAARPCLRASTPQPNLRFLLSFFLAKKQSGNLSSLALDCIVLVHTYLTIDYNQQP
jgi:hypothetical protein